ncbi:MAG: PQQ-binding-like beta-propeller repeat protein [Planctomycetes bacterium]|nr:PQQ-binding-like beta-propeller repeat protein [Planctomycetota bacterium]
MTSQPATPSAPAGGPSPAAKKRQLVLLVVMLFLIAFWVRDSWQRYQASLPPPPEPEFDGKTELQRGEAAGMPPGGPTGQSAPAIAAVGSVAEAGGHDWPQWRGPDRTGVSSEKGWFSPWPQEGPRRLWKASLGAGYASVAVSGGRVYALGYATGKDTVWCLDAATGALLWSQSYRAGTDASYPGPRATPAVEGGRVYTLNRKGIALCLDAEDGRSIWHRDLLHVPGVASPSHGFTGSPALVGDHVLLSAGKSGVALRKADGTVAWGGGEGAVGYASPVPYAVAGRQGVLFFLLEGLTSADPVDGRVQWQHALVGGGNLNAADPLFSGDRLFVSTNGFGCALLDLSVTPPGVVWKSEELVNHTSTSVLVDGMLYGFDGPISGGPATALKCVEFATGTRRWSQAGMAGTLCAADGKLVVLTDAGELIVAEASPAGYKELARAQVIGKDCYTVPVLSNGRIYCRNSGGDLVCVRAGGE